MRKYVLWITDRHFPLIGFLSNRIVIMLYRDLDRGRLFNLEKVNSNILFVANLDIIDETLVLDIKPFRHFR